MPVASLAGVMDDIMTQMASSQLSRKQKRGSQVHTPKRRSVRIEKPRSVQPSPNMKERRRTLTVFQPHTSLADHYQRMFGGLQDSKTPEASATVRSSRPVSWHPSSTVTDMDYSTQSAMIPADSFSHLALNYDGVYEALPSASQPSPNPLAMPEDPSLAWPGANTYESAPPLDQSSSWPTSMESQYYSVSGPPTYATTFDRSSWYPTNYTDIPFHIPQYQMDTLVNQEGSDSYSQPAHQINDQFATMSGHDDVALERSASKELVGMGLYDPPGTSLLQYGAAGRTSLKLEESWQPPTSLQVEDAAAQAEEDSSDEEEELPRPTDNGFTPSPFVDLSGQSFFFGEHGDDNVTNEWWYQQLKQPTTYVTGLGHGWLQA